MDTGDIIFRTVHGSRLYGLAHAGSDHDTFTVTTQTGTKAKHSVSADGIDDSVIVGFGRFMDNARRGSHQSVEAAFSRQQVWNPNYLHLRPMVASMRICGPEVFARYERTIKAFAYGSLKKRRHAVRLNINLTCLRAQGHFNPTLSANDRAYAGRLAAALEGDDLVHVLLGNS